MTRQDRGRARRKFSRHRPHSFAPRVGWNTHNVITPASLPPGNYWLAYLPSSNNLSFVMQNNRGNCRYIRYFSNQRLPNTFQSNPNSCPPTTWSFYATLNATSVALNGQCGSANGVAVSSAPTTNLCSAGTTSSVSGEQPMDMVLRRQRVRSERKL